MAKREQPACVILDLVLPKITGIEVLEQLKSDSSTRQIPVIVNTSKLLEEKEQRDLAERTVAILSKESLSQDVAIAKLWEALTKAGLILEKIDHV